jgi:hypothetical protein
MTTDIAPIRDESAILERVIALGDLSKLDPNERITYYRAVCESVGLNPLTKPLDYITLNGKLTLYANKGATDQIRRNRGVSIDRVEREVVEGIYVVTVYGHDGSGRVDSDMGTVPIRGLSGDNLANAMLKALTKAKRRLTLSLCGLGMLDELEVATIPSAQRVDVDADTGEILRLPKPSERVVTPPMVPDSELEAFNAAEAVSEPLGLDDPALFDEPKPVYDVHTEALSRDQIRQLLASANLTQADAALKAAELWPGWNPRKELTDVQRGILWDALR